MTAVTGELATREGVVAGTPAAPGRAPWSRRPRPAPGQERDGVSGASGAGPGLSVVIAVGLLLVAVADPGARFGAPGRALFWLGLALAFGATATRLAGGGPRAQRSACSWCSSWGWASTWSRCCTALGFTFHDEFLHWRTADDIATSGRLYGENPCSR